MVLKKWGKSILSVSYFMLFVLFLTPAAFAADTIKIGMVTSLSGPLATYGKQTVTGFRLGLEYATQGTMMVNGKKIEVLERDTQTNPSVAEQALKLLYRNDKVDLAIGPVSSRVAKALAPVAKQFKKILIVEPAVSSEITGADWNRYIFRTSRNSDHDAVANANARIKKGTHAMILAQNYAYGKSAAKAYKRGVEIAGGKYVGQILLPMKTDNFDKAYEKIVKKFKRYKGDKVVFVVWAGAGDPMGNLLKKKPMENEGIEFYMGGTIMAALKAYKRFEGMQGATYYYYKIPKNDMNDWFVKTHLERENSPPDFFTAGGMVAANAVVTALKKAGTTDTEPLIRTMEGMWFDTPKGKMQFRKEDHQALQVMYHFVSRNFDGVDHGVPVLKKVIGIDEMDIPINNKDRKSVV